jgi:hypothetical protein
MNTTVALISFPVPAMQHDEATEYGRPPTNSENNHLDGHDPPGPGTSNQIQWRDITDVRTPDRIPYLRLYLETENNHSDGHDSPSPGSSNQTRRQDTTDARTRRTTGGTGTTRWISTPPKKLITRHLPPPSSIEPSKQKRSQTPPRRAKRTAERARTCGGSPTIADGHRPTQHPSTPEGDRWDRHDLWIPALTPTKPMPIDIGRRPFGWT